MALSKLLHRLVPLRAGRGSYLTLDYQVEMDAIIMDGSTLKTGGVGCITNVKNPVQVARLVMDKVEECATSAVAALSSYHQMSGKLSKQVFTGRVDEVWSFIGL